VQNTGTQVHILPGVEEAPAKPPKWTERFKQKLNPKNWVKQAADSKQNTPNGRG
jgi:hypothetical protein